MIRNITIKQDMTKTSLAKDYLTYEQSISTKKTAFTASYTNTTAERIDTLLASLKCM
jgi:hypothetical protein